MRCGWVGTVGHCGLAGRTRCDSVAIWQRATMSARVRSVELRRVTRALCAAAASYAGSDGRGSRTTFLQTTVAPGVVARALTASSRGHDIWSAKGRAAQSLLETHIA